MRLRIRHETKHRYERAPTRLDQLVRLSPIESGAQRVLSWRVVDESGRPPHRFTDAYGNTTHLVSRRGSGCELAIVAEGEVERFAGGTPARETQDPRLFLRATPLTTPDDAIRALAGEARRRGGGEARGELLALARGVRDCLPHRTDATGVRTAAADALAAAGGVCQDRAHLFLAAARWLGHPARYVSGYLHGAVDTGAGAMHAWVEALTSGRGWLELDPSTGEPAALTHVRVAVGLDYDDAAPLRGVCSGGTSERLSVAVQVQELTYFAASAGWRSQQ